MATECICIAFSCDVAQLNISVFSSSYILCNEQLLLHFTRNNELHLNNK